MLEISMGILRQNQSSIKFTIRTSNFLIAFHVMRIIVSRA
jgi:hypothetical protein